MGAPASRRPSRSPTTSARPSTIRAAPQQISRIWQDAAGPEALVWPKRALFDLIGMTSAVLEPGRARQPAEVRPIPAATARDWARFGSAWSLNKGVWNDQGLPCAGFADWMHEEAPASKGQYGKGQVWLYGPEGDTPPGRTDAGFDLPDDTLVRGP